jgi:hypothetical protein
MNARLLSIYSHSKSYRVVGYLDDKAFIIEIDKTTRELLKFHSLSSVLYKHTQDFVYNCAMQTIDNNLLHIQVISSDTESNDVVETNDNDMDSDEFEAILRRATNQDAVDQIRNHVLTD